MTVDAIAAVPSTIACHRRCAADSDVFPCMNEYEVVLQSVLRRAPVIVASIFAGLLLAVPTLSAQTTVVRPTEIDEVLVNPGMGIETFQRFQGQPLNEGVRW